MKKQNAKQKPEQQPADAVLKAIGARLKHLRKEAGYTNADFFAYDNRIAPAQYNRYERGEDLRVSTLVRLVNIHGLSLEAFFKIELDNKK